ncbi:MAG: glycosyltransferase family 2 protein [Candidatus Omnitrophica bacterium]|nr:glycosyltransferase family 2 protein [Candidatus Omnitrophota bacterium]MCM8776897.1 glycosyltransferase family 2 protein [Candidatus Omnitrophota bacterium]
MNKDITVLIPVHNEERTIGELVSKLKQKFETVIVVDDGSYDKTGLLAEENGATVLKHSICRGKGEALKTGFSYIIKNLSGISAVLTIDGDGQHKVEDVANFEKAYRRNKNISIWVGKRKVKGTDMPFIRRVTNISMSILISLFSFQWIPDTQCGFRLIKKDVIKDVNLLTSHFETESELLIKAGWKMYRIGSVPISTVYSKEKSKINPTGDTVRFFRMLLIIFFPLLLKVKGWKKN